MRPHRPTRKMGLAVLAGGLAFVGSAEATELITDGSFENTTTAPSSPIVKVGGTPAPGGWRLEHFQHISLLHALYASRAGRVRSAISATLPALKYRSWTEQPDRNATGEP